jgi:hypothetical protein
MKSQSASWGRPRIALLRAVDRLGVAGLLRDLHRPDLGGVPAAAPEEGGPE